MKNFKRILALVIATIMVVGTFASVSAAGDKWYSNAVAYIEDCGIAVIGTKAESKITRNEFVMWVAKLESHQLDDDAWFDEITNVEFSDVTPDHHRAAIAYSHERGFIIGNGDGTFSPDKIISFAEASAVIVRLMGYENKVTDTSAEKWAYNYMQVANTYCKAIDDTFLSHTGTYNPDYELTYGEAAYLLATIMNLGKATDDRDYSRTSDGIDLGEYFEDARVGRVGKSYYVASITRKSAGTSKSSPIALGGKGQKYTNEIDTAKDVTLIATDGSGSLVINGEDFLKLLRVSLGLAPERDIANEEAEINVFEKVDVGSIVNTVVDKADGTVKSLSVSENSVAVDTYLQGKTASVNGGYGSGSSPAATTIATADDLPKYLGWTVREATGTTNDYKPVLPASYSDALVTSWTNVKKSAAGVVTSATLNFQGKTYTVDDNNNEINIYVVENNELKLLTADEAVKTLINAAQGECYVVFSDVDGNGSYDTAIVKESSPFLYTADLEIPSTDSTVRDYLSSVSGGTVVGQSTVKGKEVGTVVFNKKVLTGGTAGGSDSTTYMSTDSFVFSTKAADATGKVQLVLCASNKHFIVDNVYSDYNISLPFYAAVDIASFATGVIEEVDAFSVNGYWVAKIRSVDGSTVQTVYIPTTASETVTLPVTIGAATAEYTFNSSTWLKFLTEDLQAAIDEGIVSAVGDPNHKASTAAWMAGKYVQYATDTDNIAIAMLGTDVVTGESGFVTGVTKTDTGDNTFKVTIATSKKGGAVGGVYLQKVVDSMIGNDIAGGDHIKVDDQGRLICRNTGKMVYAKDMETGKMYEYSAEAYNNWVNGTADSITAVESSDYGDTTDYGWHRVGTAGDYSYGILAANGTIKAQDKNGDGIPDVCGWYADNMFDYVDNRGAYGVGGVKTVEVRANASSMFDWENYQVYNALFSGKLGDPNGMANGKVNPSEDLIYVTVAEDAGNLKYLLYGDRNTYAENSATETSASFRIGNAGTGKNIYGTAAWWFMTYSGEITPQDSWKDVEGEYILSITPVAGSKVDTQDQYNTVNGYTEKYTAKVGFGPYYERTYNTTKKAYEYVLKFARVESYTEVTGTASAEVDKTSLLMTPLYYGESGKESVQVKATTTEDMAKYTIANGYYVDSTTKLVYIIHNSDSVKISYKKDNSGKLICTTKYDWTNAVADSTFVPTETDKLFSTYEIDKYATLTYKAKDRSEDGWYPGASYLVIDDKTFSCSTSTPVVIVTPSKDGFTTSVTTVGALPEQGLFVTAWNTAEENGAITAIAVLGEVATSTGTTTEPGSPAISLKEGESIVYLDKTANPIVRAAAYGKNWIVISDKSAYALPTGEDVGAIYREYSTYEEATKAANIELSVTGGHWYKVDQNGKIIEDMTTVTYVDLTATYYDMSGMKKVMLRGSVSGSNYDFSEKEMWVAEDTAVSVIERAFNGYVQVGEGEGTNGSGLLLNDPVSANTIPENTVALYNNNGTWQWKTCVKASPHDVYGAGTFGDAALPGANYRFGNTTVNGVNTVKALAMDTWTLLADMGDVKIYHNDYDGFVSVENGRIYLLDSNYRKVESSATLSGLKTGTLTYTNASGTSTLATIDGVKNVEISGYNFAWFYRNADGSVLYKAGNSSSVSVASAETYAAAYKTEQDAYNTALANYNKAVDAGYLSEERIAYYKEALDNAEAALTAKKNSLLDRYFNGQFWNCSNSPYYVYVQMSELGFQEATARLNFNYIVVKDASGNDVYCVFSDEYTFG